MCTNPGTRPHTGPGTKLSNKPSTKLSTKLSAKPSTKPGTRPGTRQSASLDTGAGADAGSGAPVTRTAKPAILIQEDLSRNFGFLLNDVARLMRTTYDRRVREQGLTRSQWWVLTHLFRSDGVTQTELAEILEVEKPTLGRLVDRLEAKGWVCRQHDARDRRVWRVFLGPDAEPVMRQMREIAAGLRSDALSGLSALEREAFVDTLIKVKANLSRLPGVERRKGSQAAARAATVSQRDA